MSRDVSFSSEFVNDGFVTQGTWKKFDIYMNGHRHRNHSKVQIIFLVIVLCCVPACLYTHFFPRLTAPHCLAQVVPRTTRIVEQIFEATSMTSGNIKLSEQAGPWNSHMRAPSAIRFLAASSFCARNDDALVMFDA